MPKCIKWGEERNRECTRTEDQGYNECARREDRGYRDCCDWRPCRWFCRAWVWVSNIVCVAWTWISKIVCVAWTWITTAVCVLWDVVTTVVNGILVTLESIFGWVLSAVGFIIELILAIPFVGTIIKFIINFVTTIVIGILSIGDLVLGLLGIRPEKKLRVCTVILRDENGDAVASDEVARSLLQVAVDVYKRDCNVRIIPSKPFQYSSGFADAETVNDDWFIVDGNNSSSTLLDVPCSSATSALGLPSSGFQLKSSLLCFFGAWRRVIGYGSPVTCFLIRDISDAIGCHVTFTDYATIEGRLTMPHPSPRTLGHEVAHACLVGHTCVDDDNANMMATRAKCNPASTAASDRSNPRINTWQTLVIRASKHVTYF